MERLSDISLNAVANNPNPISQMNEYVLIKIGDNDAHKTLDALKSTVGVSPFGSDLEVIRALKKWQDVDPKGAVGPVMDLLKDDLGLSKTDKNVTAEQMADKLSVMDNMGATAYHAYKAKSEDIHQGIASLEKSAIPAKNDEEFFQKLQASGMPFSDVYMHATKEKLGLDDKATPKEMAQTLRALDVRVQELGPDSGR